MSLRIALLGYGKMGKAVEAEANARGHEITHRIDAHNAASLLPLLSAADTDVVIEFTHPESAVANFRLVLQKGLPLVTGTTGWLDQRAEVESWVQAQNGAFLYSSNFSPGVNVLFRLNQILAKLMNGQEGYDAYVEEAHHRHKKDAPSGTAITLLEGMLTELKGKSRWEYAGFAQRAPLADEISVSVTRAGEIIGKHTVAYRSAIDEIRISHEAFNRRGFALGAVLAAEWIHDKKGFYNFAQIFE